MTSPDSEPAPTPRSVFVTVGTDHHPFDRLITWVDAWASGGTPGGVECFVQYGTSRRPTVADGSPYLEHQEMERRSAEAGAIVCHGGPGTIIDCLRAGTKPIVVPRRHALGEHVDDHQVRFSRRLEASGYIRVADSAEALHRLLGDALSGSPEFRADALEDVVKQSIARFEEIVTPLLPPSADPSATSR